MRKEALKYEDVLNYITKLPHAAFKDVIYHYVQNNNIDVSSDIESLTIFDLQKRLEKLNINKVCPNCGSIQIIKNGKQKNIQRFKCKDCNTQFTLFTNTILEKTKWHWNVWVKVLEMTLNNYSLESIRHTLLLKEQTLEARKATNNRFFKFDEEDNVINFDKRKYLSEQPNTKLKRICKKHGIKYKCKWAKWSIISIILKQPDIGNIIIELIDQDKYIKISEEDREYINHQEYKTINST